MPNYQISGADRATGAERTVTIPARGEAEARRVAEQTMYIATLFELRDDAAPPTRPASAPTVAYASPAAGKIPDYPGIRSGATLLVVLGLIFLGVGLLAIVFGVYVLTSRDRPTAAAAIGGIPLIAYAVVSVGYGILLRFVASLGEAVRDMARNSFKMLNK